MHIDYIERIYSFLVFLFYWSYYVSMCNQCWQSSIVFCSFTCSFVCLTLKRHNVSKTGQVINNDSLINTNISNLSSACVLLFKTFLNQLFAICIYIQSILHLLYPFSWHLTYVPLLPWNILELVEAPGTFIMGCNVCHSDVIGTVRCRWIS